MAATVSDPQEEKTNKQNAFLIGQTTDEFCCKSLDQMAEVIGVESRFHMLETKIWDTVKTSLAQIHTLVYIIGHGKSGKDQLPMIQGEDGCTFEIADLFAIMKGSQFTCQVIVDSCNKQTFDRSFFSLSPINLDHGSFIMYYTYDTEGYAYQNGASFLVEALTKVKSYKDNLPGLYGCLERLLRVHYKELEIRQKKDFILQCVGISPDGTLARFEDELLEKEILNQTLQSTQEECTSKIRDCRDQGKLEKILEFLQSLDGSN